MSPLSREAIKVLNGPKEAIKMKKILLLFIFAAIPTATAQTMRKADTGPNPAFLEAVKNGMLEEREWALHDLVQCQKYSNTLEELLRSSLENSRVINKRALSSILELRPQPDAR